MRVPNKKFVFEKFSKLKKQARKWGKIGKIFSNWDELKLNGYFVEFKKETEYLDWADKNVENLCIVKKGSGKLVFGKKSYKINENFAFKIYPSQEPVIVPDRLLVIVSIQKHSSNTETKKNKIDLKKLEVVDTKKLSSKVYEFETLAKEVFTPKHKNGLGLIKFVFVNPIPIHLHPYSGRLILPISGKGFTYMEPNLYEAHKDTFALFSKGVVHTNGPIAGNTIELYAVQMPWVASGIDHKDIAGSPKFVRYIGVTPPKKLWKKKEEMEMLIRKINGLEVEGY